MYRSLQRDARALDAINPLTVDLPTDRSLSPRLMQSYILLVYIG